MHIISQPSQHPIGLDISDLSLKLVQLKARRHSIKLQTISKLAVPEGYIKGGKIVKKDAVVELIKKLTTETIFGKISNKDVVACLPEEKTFVKLIKVVNDKKKNFSESLADEIQKNIPLNLAEVNYDWQVIKKEKDHQKILIGAIEKTIADEYHEVLKSAELNPVALEIESIAIVRALLPRRHNPKKTIIIIDIGAKRSSFIAYADKTILFTVSLPISGDKTTHAISKSLSINHEKAESAKIICGLNKELANGAVARALEGQVNSLIKKTAQALQHLFEQYPEYSAIEKIHLCGGGANIKGLSKIINDRLGVKTVPGNVFSHIHVNPTIENKHLNEEFATLKNIAQAHKIKQNFSLQFATAIGLALRGIHLDDL